MLPQLLLAILPGLAIAWFIYRLDKYEREHVVPLTMAFCLGMLTTVPVFKLQEWYYHMGWEDTTTMAATFFSSFILVALNEETIKFVTLLLFSIRRSSFNEPIDGIVYSVMISMGFATLENVFYAIQFGLPTTAVRAFTAVPAHAVFATMMGYFVGKARFYPDKRQKMLLWGWLVPVVVHGIYDFFIMQEVYDGLILLAVVTLIISLYFAFRLIREEQEESPFRPKDDGNAPQV